MTREQWAALLRALAVAQQATRSSKLADEIVELRAAIEQELTRLEAADAVRSPSRVRRIWAWCERHADTVVRVFVDTHRL